MKNTWDERYSQPEYIYGTHPNVWLVQKLKGITPGRALFPAEGEGRNAVYAALNGWESVAFDQSSEGRAKAMKLANLQKVTIDYSLHDLSTYKAPICSFDAIALIYVHMPAAIRNLVHQNLTQLLKPGGYLILEAFTKDQIRNNSGGPRDEHLLYTASDIAGDFGNLDFIEFIETTVNLDEGLLHRGEAFVVRLFARKPLPINL